MVWCVVDRTGVVDLSVNMNNLICTKQTQVIKTSMSLALTCLGGREFVQQLANAKQVYGVT